MSSFVKLNKRLFTLLYDSAIVNMIVDLEWQNSAISNINYVKSNTGAPITSGATTGEKLLDTVDNKLYTSINNDVWDAGVTLADKDRYIFKISGTGDVINQPGNQGTATNYIYQSNGFGITSIAPKLGMFISVDDETTCIYYYGGSSWNPKYWEQTTASNGLMMVGVDVQLDGTSLYFIESAQDAIGSALTNTATITFTYDDLNGIITADLNTNSVDESYLSNLGTGVLGQLLSSDGSGGFSWINDSSIKSTERRTVNLSAVTTGDAQLSVTDVFGSDNPRSETFPQVYINGKLTIVAESNATRTTSEAYFGNNSGTAIAVNALTGTENLYVNGSILGYDLDGNDEITVHYTI